MKKISIITLSLLLAGASAFAWSKKSENLGNLGRTYISISGAVNTAKYKAPTGGTASPTGAQASAVINAPILKPSVNAFRDISWAGLDGNIFFNYDYSNSIDIASNSAKFNSYNVGAQLTPYLNFETGLPFLKAIKPFGLGYAGYEWASIDLNSMSESDNYFVYGVGAGVEFVLLDEVSVTPIWKWNGNAKSGLAAYQEAGVEASYWVTDQFCVSVFWMHNLGREMTNGLDLRHADVIGAKFKLGFLR